MRFIVAAILAGSALPALAASLPIEMVLSCQQNLSDGRILVSDGTLLPADARYAIKRYTPKRQADGWYYGPCVLAVTKGVSG